MQFVQLIIYDIHRTGTFVVEFLHKRKRSWSASEQAGLGATLVNPVFIEESKEEKTWSSNLWRHKKHRRM